ncbi:MAG: endonuclease/exonuclease/phosphatase family protein [Actinomycetia bacterium]|nr:endonuclease/exonuclease/phosphatase family protein [Actinomycetes bacterium]
MDKQEFLAWAYDDLLTNTTRGVLAEYIVAKALGTLDTKRREWDNVDLRVDGVGGVEVKSAAYVQSWKARPSTISFDISPKLGWDASTDTYAASAERSAAVYVFCLLTGADHEQHVDPLDIAEWTFYVLPTSVLNRKVPTQKRIRLNPLIELGPRQCTYDELKAVIHQAARPSISVRLVEWNVAMSLQTKAPLLAKLNPTVAVLPESANPDKTGQALQDIGATLPAQWDGANPNKGLLAVAFDGWELRVDDSYDRDYQWVMPLHLTGPRHIRLLAVWDMSSRGRGYESARQLGSCRASMDHYQEFLSGGSDLTVISGDFNKSVYWDYPTKRTKFGDFMDQLESRGFVSAYHFHHGCERGAEPEPTLWWMRNVGKPYHIDYTFVSRPEAITAVTVGSSDDWLTHSDHAPMTVDLQL